MGDPMEQSVEVLARAFSCDTQEEWSERENFPDASAGAETFRVAARAVLAEIAPLLVQAEREACAKVADERAKVYAEEGGKLASVLGEEVTVVKIITALEEENIRIAAAILERGRG